MVLLDFQQALEQAQAFVVARAVGVEGAGEIEGGAEPGFPLFLVGTGGGAAAVEQLFVAEYAGTVCRLIVEIPNKHVSRSFALTILHCSR